MLDGVDDSMITFWAGSFQLPSVVCVLSVGACWLRRLMPVSRFIWSGAVAVATGRLAAFKVVNWTNSYSSVSSFAGPMKRGCSMPVLALQVQNCKFLENED